MRFCNNKIMSLLVKTRILTFLDLGNRGGKSSTVTTRHHSITKLGLEQTQNRTVAF